MRKRTFIFALSLMLFGIFGAGCAAEKKEAPATKPQAQAETNKKVEPVKVYYSKNISPEAVKKVYARVKANIDGKVAIKFHRNDPYTESADKVALFKALQEEIPNSTLVETTFGGGQKEAKEMQERFKNQGLIFAPIDVLNADGGVEWESPGARLLKHPKVAKNLANYNSLVIYAPFRGTAYPGYGAALSNIGVGLQDGKGLVHGPQLNKNPDFFERMAEAANAITSRFDKKIAYVTLLSDVAIDCECRTKEKVNLGVIASTDIVAVDRAAFDLLFNQPQHKGHDLNVKIGTRLGLYQQEYMKKLNMGTDKYVLVDVDKE
ncbi:MAG: DUF362 domain-containing protein [Phascolarctobacterium sp.]|nr:DUF362 domain-containing protein [Phascolarctobacterium sp.]